MASFNQNALSAVASMDDLMNGTEPGMVEIDDEGQRPDDFITSIEAVEMDDPDAPITIDPETGEIVAGAFTEDDADGYEMDPDVDDHNENLAEYMTEQELGLLASKVVEYVKADKESRKPWDDLYKRGLILMGLVEEPDDGPFPGASTVTFPLIAEAATQFNARAIQELFPAAGPVKGVVYGKPTDEAQKSASRVENYMNYQCTEEDESFYDELDQMLFYLPIAGSAFKKNYYDRIEDRLSATMIKADDLIVPYTATSLAKAPRYAHEFRLSANELRKSQTCGLYRDVTIATPVHEQHRETTIDEETAEGRTDVRHEDDDEYTIYEMYIDCSLENFPDVDDDGKETGIALPYIVTVERDSEIVLAVRRNWRVDDRMKRRRSYITHYKFLPGLGFYGYGLPHLIGGLGRAATGVVRAILDGAASSSLQGGFKAKDAAIKGGEIIFEPGKWKDVDLTAEELSKAFYTPPFKEPSNALFNVLGTLVDAGRRFSSTTEAMVGDASNRGPVGTTVALIEQGSKVFSGIHKRLHNSARHEFSVRYEINAEFVPEEGYPYMVEGEDQEVYREDFNQRVRIRPVSDPNIFSQTQRIAVAQSTLELAQKQPALYDLREANQRMLEALRAPDIDTLMPDKSDVPPMDPISENQAILLQRPVRAILEQDHEAHIEAHMAFMQHPEFGGNPQASQLITPAMIAHLAEHMAHLYRIRMAQLGVLTPPTDFAAEPGKPFAAPTSPAEQDMMAARAAQVTEGFKQMRGIASPPPPPDPKMAKTEQDLKLDAAAHQQEMQQSDETHQQEMRQSEEDHALEMRQAAQTKDFELGAKAVTQLTTPRGA